MRRGGTVAQRGTMSRPQIAASAARTGVSAADAAHRCRRGCWKAVRTVRTTAFLVFGLLAQL